MSLYAAETRRLVKRRFTRYFTLGAVVVLAAIAVAMFVTNHQIGPAQIAGAKAQAHADYQRNLDQAADFKKRCEAAKGTADAQQYPSNCDEIGTPTEDDFDAQWYLPATFDFQKKFPDLVTTLAALLSVVGFVIGASFVGAEWSSGGMANLLLWRPQRLRVLGTKLLAFLVGLAGLTVLLSAAWTGIFTLVAKYRGTSASMTTGAWKSLALTEARGLALVVVAGAVGFGLASLGRHTAMALGVAIGLVVVFQFGLGTALALAKVKFAEAYLLPLWIVAWMKQKYDVQDYNACNFSGTEGCRPDTFTITWHMAGAALAVAFVVIVGAALWTVRRRDIT
ncbi:MAG TPA: ABC transporter permease subunit [Actinoplanes sp.]|jgi:ABC-type transport system involved in multi-copper enzyme maturation permease subunit